MGENVIQKNVRSHPQKKQGQNREIDKSVFFRNGFDDKSRSY